MNPTPTPHADSYKIKGLIAGSNPELLPFLTEAEYRYMSHPYLIDALTDCIDRLEAGDPPEGGKTSRAIERARKALAIAKGRP